VKTKKIKPNIVMLNPAFMQGEASPHIKGRFFVSRWLFQNDVQLDNL